MPKRVSTDLLTVSEVAKRSGVSVSALHFYERRGLISSFRTVGNQRRYPRHTIRRVSVIQIAKTLGFSLSRIAELLGAIPSGTAMKRSDWRSVSRSWEEDLSRRIKLLTALRDELSSCIGCGCLSMQACALLNPGDSLSAEGPGAVRLNASTHQKIAKTRDRGNRPNATQPSRRG
jgi:MerR family redox-sensitive transcriptional activator SoxR